MWSQADAFFLRKVVSWASCAVLLHVGLLLINKTQIRAWHVKLVSCKGPVIKQISSGIKRVINADDQHSPSDELGLGESQGATVCVVSNFIRVQGSFQMCPFAANAFLGFKKLESKNCNILCKLKIFHISEKTEQHRRPSHSYQMQNISLLFCKVETKSVRCLLQGGGRGDAESAPDLCPWRGRKCCVCSVAATASALWGNVTAVALGKPSGEQSLRASPCLHFTSAPRWLTNTSLHAIMCWSCMHSHMHARLYVTCRTSFYSHSLVVVTWEIIFTGGPHKVTVSQFDTLWCAALSSTACAATLILYNARANAFTSNGERHHYLNTIDRGPTWGQANRACLE